MITLGIDIGTSGVKVVLVGDDDHVIASAAGRSQVVARSPASRAGSARTGGRPPADGLDELQGPHRGRTRRDARHRPVGPDARRDAARRRRPVLRPVHPVERRAQSQPSATELDARLAGAARRSPATSRCPASPRRSCCGCASTSRKCSRASPRCCCPRPTCAAPDRRDARGHVGCLGHAVARRRRSATGRERCSPRPACAASRCRGWSRAARPTGRAARGTRHGAGAFTRAPVVAGGAGDNAAGAVRRRRGARRATPSSRSGPRACCWPPRAHFAPDPARAVHAFCHAVPNTWHQMGVMLSAAASLAWWAARRRAPTKRELLAEIDAQASDPTPVLVPALSRRRAHAAQRRTRARRLPRPGRRHDTARSMTRAVLEGVAYAFADAQQALASAGTRLAATPTLIGGGARSPLWAQHHGRRAGRAAAPGRGERHRLRARRRAARAAGSRRQHAVARPRIGCALRRRPAEALHRDRHARWRGSTPMARDFAR